MTAVRLCLSLTFGALLSLPVWGEEQKFILVLPAAQSAASPAASYNQTVAPAKPATAQHRPAPLSKSSGGKIFPPISNKAAAASGKLKAGYESDVILSTSPDHSGLVLTRPNQNQAHRPRIKFVLSTDELFEEAKDRLTEVGERRLKALEPKLRQLSGCPIEIIGHSDHLGFESYNNDLTARLAKRVKTWIIANGLAKASAVTSSGVGSRQPLFAENLPNGRDNGAGRARNRRIEILIDQDSETPLEENVTADLPAKKDQNTSTPMALPPELDKGLVDMVPVSEEDLQPHVSATGSETASGRSVDTTEWGRGGSNFGENLSSLGAALSGYGGNAGSQYNADGKRVVKLTPDPGKLEQQRKDTIEAQNEFGLWRDR